MNPKFSEDVRPITDLKVKTAERVSHVQQTRRPLLITQRGRGAAVLESLEVYEQREARYEAIEAILKGLRQAREGKLHPNEEALKLLDQLGL